MFAEADAVQICCKFWDTQYSPPPRRQEFEERVRVREREEEGGTGNRDLFTIYGW